MGVRLGEERLAAEHHVLEVLQCSGGGVLAVELRVLRVLLLPRDVGGPQGGCERRGTKTYNPTTHKTHT